MSLNTYTDVLYRDQVSDLRTTMHTVYMYTGSVQYNKQVHSPDLIGNMMGRVQEMFYLYI
jgi:hypothetical protein